MKRFDKFKTMSVEEVANEVCDLISDKVDCDFCTATERCSMGHSGLLDYLNEEVGEDD